jgi:predicted ATPase
MRELPSGTVTFLFTDIEGSTRLLQELGDGYAGALAEHRRLLRDAFERHRGAEVDTQGDAFFVAFERASDALAAADEGQKVLAPGPVRVRMGVHSGEPTVTEEGYVGIDVHRAARIAAAGHGGQVLLSQATRDLARRDDLCDLGEHRLKDLSAAERIWQLGDGDFPRLKTLYQTNLPVPATAFVGREQELTEASELLLDGVRLLTLSGPGGTGKTRLALQAAAAAADGHPDGVWWVPLASLADPALVLPAAGEVLGAKGDLRREIADRQLLLLLDNFEHVIEAAGEVAGLLGACPHLAVLVTSRERLQVAGEHEYAVPAMAPPDGFELFAARARALGTEVEEDEAVLELCERLDNLPLALELAAARTKLFSPAQLLERLSTRLDLFKGGRDADPRQRTLRATIEWSHDLLIREEQQLFARLSVFAGGCTYEAAEAICNADEDTLQSLIDKSLLRWRDSTTGERRYWMLETIREYARERLAEHADCEDVRRWHAEWLLALAQRAGGSFWHTDDPELLAGMTVEDDNLRAALGWSLDADAALAASLAASLTRYWFVRGAYREGARWCDAAIARMGDASAYDRACVLIGASEFARFQHDYQRSIALKNEAISLLRGGEVDDEGLLAATIKDLGDIAGMQGDWERAEALLDESLEIRRRLGTRSGIAHSLSGRGELELARGNWPGAQAALAEALELARGERDAWNVALVTHSLAEVVRRSGEPDLAVPGYLEAMEMGLAFDAPQLIAECLEGLAAVKARRGDSWQATRLAGAAEAMRERAGASVAYPREHERLLSALRTAMSDQEFASAWASGRTLTTERAIEYGREVGAEART